MSTARIPSSPLRAWPAIVAAVFASAALSPITAAAAPHSPPAAHQTATATPAKDAVQRIVLKTGIANGKMVYLDEQDKPNPTLRATVGETLEIVVSSGEGAEHDIALPDLGIASKKFNATSGPVTLRFKADKAGKFAYICTVAGHRQIGMEGMIEVSGSLDPSAAASPVKVSSGAPSLVPASPPALAPANPAAVSVALDPTLVPAAITEKTPTLRKYRIETVELSGKLDDGTTFTYWTFDKKVPGPMLRVRVGDTVQLTLANAANSTQVHSIDLHAVSGGHGGGQHTQVAPGKEATIAFKALNPGLYVYHCATPLIPHHMAAGMYGMILVEPEGGLPAVDREFYVMQGEIYTTHKHGTKGDQVFDFDKMAAEQPDYFVFNGAVGSLTKEHRMTAKVGETVRVYFGVGGPNKISSFHVIGEIFEKVYSEGSVSSVRKHVQTTLVPAGGAAITEFKLDYPGSYMLVDHALSRVGKGLVAAIEVTGAADPAVYKPGKPGKEDL
jgi:nitrite reductase (NO-forming)